MTIRVTSMYVSPVKSLALSPIDRAFLDKPGIAGDRAFHVVDDQGKLYTQRECPAFVRVRAAYDLPSNVLTLTMPDGSTVEGAAEAGEAVETSFFGRPLAAKVVRGAFAEALSTIAGQPLRLAKADAAGASFDGFPISLCSTESVQALAAAAGQDAVDGRRFRQNIYITGTTAHGEDKWLGGTVRIGQALLNVKMRDSRCVMTQHSPETGEPDLDTLKIIAAYRTDQPKEVNFGVYCTVAESGDVAVGDEVVPQ